MRPPRRGSQSQGGQDPYPRQQLWHVVGRAVRRVRQTNNNRLRVHADTLITLGRWPNSFPEKDGWDRLLALNVKSIFYGPCHPCLFMLSTDLERPVTVGFTPLLAKDSTNHDPARVINISSVAAFSPIASGSKLASGDNGLWSCLSCLRFPFHEC